MYDLPIEFYTDEWNCTTAMIYAVVNGKSNAAKNIIKGRANVYAQMLVCVCATTTMLRWCCVLCYVVCYVLCCLNQMISPVESTTV